jgi:hypothetical protein
LPSGSIELGGFAVRGADAAREVGNSNGSPKKGAAYSRACFIAKRASATIPDERLNRHRPRAASVGYALQQGKIERFLQDSR